METATVTVPATLVSFIERRRAGSVPPRGIPFVERRRPVPVLVADADDLHRADAEALLADGLDDALGDGSRTAAPVDAAHRLADAIGPAALAAHRLPATVLDLLR